MTPIAYLVSRYPAVSHTFILREVAALRENGFTIHTASINSPDRDAAAMTEAERAEAARTFVVKRTSPVGILAALFRTVVSRPAGILRGFLYAFALAGADLRCAALFLCYFGEAVVLGDWMRRRGVSHLHVHFATPAATVALIARRIFGVRFSLSVHGPDEFYDVDRHRLAEKFAAAEFICCIGSYCRSQVMKIAGPQSASKIEVAPLGVDTDVFRPAARPAAGEPIRLLCVGRLVAAKGQAILIEAVRELAGRKLPVELHLVGDGPDRGMLEAAARGAGARIVFHGAVNQDEIRKLYARATLFVLPSFAEGIPVVLMEAMAMTIPCVSTIVNGIPELIESGRSGVLVPPSDPVALADVIERLARNPEQAQALGDAGRQRVLERYHLGVNTQKLASALRRRLEMQTA